MLDEKIKSKIQLSDGEQIKEFVYKPSDYKCYVSNYGRVFTKSGRELTKIYRGKTNKTYYINMCKGKKHIYLSLPRLVYRTFIDNDLPENCYIVHKDKNRLNCKVDNLELGLEKRKIGGELPQEKYNLFASPTTLEYVRKKLFTWYNGDFNNIKDSMDFEDLIQESLLLIYKATYNYKIIEDSEQNSKCWRKFVYAIVEKYVCKHYIRDYRIIKKEHI